MSLIESGSLSGRYLAGIAQTVKQRSPNIARNFWFAERLVLGDPTAWQTEVPQRLPAPKSSTIDGGSESRSNTSVISARAAIGATAPKRAF
jgi:hypothetical protein